MNKRCSKKGKHFAYMSPLKNLSFSSGDIFVFQNAEFLGIRFWGCFG